MPLAKDKQIDLGLVGEGHAQIVADEMGLQTLVKNLVENAIRHTTRWLRRSVLADHIDTSDFAD